jgi:hypothetical protein
MTREQANSYRVDPETRCAAHFYTIRRLLSIAAKFQSKSMQLKSIQLRSLTANGGKLIGFPVQDSAVFKNPKIIFNQAWLGIRI